MADRATMHKKLSPDKASGHSAHRRPPVPPRPATGWRLAAHARLACVILAGAVVHLALWQVSEPPALFSDFYKAYFPAAEVLWETGAGSPWPFTEMGAGGFVNVPILAWTFVPLVPLGEEAAGWAFLGIGVLATFAAYLTLTRLACPGVDVAAPLALIFLVNGPLLNSLREGNTTHFVLLMLVAAFVLLRNGSDFGAGLLLGLAALIKLPLFLYGLYFLLRGRWRVVAGGACMSGGLMLLSIAVFGLAHNTGWFDCCVEPFLGSIIPAFNVQSIDGYAIRLITGTSGLASWDPMEPPPAYKAARLVLFAALLVAVVLAMRRAHRPDALAPSFGRLSARDTLECALVLNLALVTSPISWSHYYLLMLLPWGLYLGGRLPLAEDAVTRRLVWISMILSSLPVVVLPLHADLIGEFAARTVVSACFFGGVAMMLALMRSLLQLSHPPQRASSAV